jgi:hypothetical protein
MKSESILIIAVVIFCLFFFIPIGLMLAGLAVEVQFQPGTTRTVDMVAGSAGLSVCKVTDIKDTTPGSSSTRMYVISSDCSSTDPAKSITLYVQAFNDQASRDAAIRGYHSKTLGHTKPALEVIPHGNFLILLKEPYNRELATRLYEQIKAAQGP